MTRSPSSRLLSFLRVASTCLLCVGAILTTASVARVSHAAPPDFNRQVRPILAQYCFACHGPDEKGREAGLRLDTRDGALAALDSGQHAIVAGKPDASELLRRVHSTDDDVRMPPPATKKRMTEAEKTILRDWIADGAPYAPHWAFQPVRPAPLPNVARREWTRSPLDRYVLQKLEQERLAPSPLADRYTLVRRLYLDLLGIPPTPEQADAFVADVAPDAYERLIDRLLASPFYGERWARRWLDLARYADTNGYEKDRPRSMWPYRDWVIRALNADLPFDQFTVEQIAGDMLPNATIDQRIATGFHRNTMINEEGGIDPLEFRYHAMVDRVNTTGTVWLGLTLVCANCHTHKFDPIPQTEYFGLFALLNNADEPELDVPDPAVERQRREIDAKIAALEADLPNRFPPAGELQWSSPQLISAKAASGSKLEPQADGSLLATGPVPDVDAYTLVFESDAADVTHLKLETLTHPSLGNQGPGRTPHGNFVLTEINVRTAASNDASNAQEQKIAAATAEIEQDKFPVRDAFDGKTQTGWAIHNTSQPLNQNRAATFQFAQPVAASGHAANGPTAGGKSAGKTKTRWTITLAQQFGGQHTIGRLRLSLGRLQTDGRPLEVRRQENLERRFTEWLAAQPRQNVRWTPATPATATSNLPLLTLLDDGSILASGDQSKSDTYELAFDNVPAGVTAVRIDALADDRLPKHGPGRVYYEGPHGDFFLSNIDLASSDAGGASRVASRPFQSASQSFANGGNTAAAAIDDNKQTGWSIDGGQGQSHHAVFNLKEPTPHAGRVVLKLLFERYYAAGLGRFRVSFTTDLGAAASNIPPAATPLLGVPAAQLSPADRGVLRQYFLSVAPELASERQAIQALRKQIPAPTTSLVFVERPASNPRPTHRHHRGEFLQPKEEVAPSVLSLAPGLPSDAPRNRLSLARWLASPENPLVGRVTMNRQWAAFFGRGIVRTTEDFGYQGESPSNAELLDWLASEFIRQGWSMKRMHRTIVASATYRQSSTASPDILARDPNNVLLERGGRFRLEAELVRDAVLSISGLLTTRLGGPSVFPPQPTNVTTEGAYGALAWRTSEGGDRYRRGLYTFAKRTAPYAMFTTFDGPSGEACVARRELSNTPLQSLTLLNDAVFLEAAQALGRQLASGAPADFVASVSGPDGVISLPAPTEDQRRAAYLFRRCVTRPPTDAELKLVLEFYERQRQRFIAGELAPAPLAGPGEGDIATRAAWTATARALLNLDESITRD